MNNSNFYALSSKLALAFIMLSGISISVAAEPNKSNVGAELLAPNAAFKPEIRQRDAFTAELRVEIAPGYYLYRDRIRVEQLRSPSPAKKISPKQNSDKRATLPSKATVVNLALSKPDGKPTDDPTFGRVDIYDTNTTMLIDLTTLGKTNQNLSLSVISQGCAAVGVCFPPQKQMFTLKYQPNALVMGQWSRPTNPEGDNTISFGTSGLTSALPTNGAPASSPAPVRAAKPL